MRSIVCLVFSSTISSVSLRIPRRGRASASEHCISVAARAVRGVLQLLRGVSEDGSGPARLAVHVDERIALEAVVPLPLDGEVGVGLFDVDGLGVAVPCQWCGKPVVFIEQPGISGLGRERDKLTDRDDSSVVSGGAALNVAYLIGETKVLAVNHALAWCTLDGSSGGGHGPVHQAARRSSHLRLSLLRSHCHSRLPERTVAA